VYEDDPFDLGLQRRMETRIRQEFELAESEAMILAAFLLLGLQTIATLIRLGARLTGREIGIRERRSDAPLRIE